MRSALISCEQRPDHAGSRPDLSKVLYTMSIDGERAFWWAFPARGRTIPRLVAEGWTAMEEGSFTGTHTETFHASVGGIPRAGTGSGSRMRSFSLRVAVGSRRSTSPSTPRACSYSLVLCRPQPARDRTVGRRARRVVATLMARGELSASLSRRHGR
jgi:hypothetical protein